MFKKKKLKLIANTHSTGLIDLFPLEKSRFPGFFSNLPKIGYAGNIPNNVRICAGLTDLYSRSISIQSWQDIDITVTSNGTVSFDAAQPEFAGMSHPLKTQTPGAWPEYVNAKLTSPWMLECNKDVQWTMIQNTWSQTHPGEFLVVPGNLEFKYQNMSNINLLIKKPKEGSTTIRIKAGDPLALLIPNFEEEFDLENQYMDQAKWTKLEESRWIFSKGPAPYARLRSLLRSKKL